MGPSFGFVSTLRGRLAAVVLISDLLQEHNRADESIFSAYTAILVTHDPNKHTAATA